MYRDLSALGLNSEKVNLTKNLYIGIMVASGIAMLLMLIYVPISVYKYYKSGGITLDITNIITSV